MIRHGLHHASSADGTASWFASKGFRHAPAQARLSALGELAIGSALAVGLLTSFAAAGLIATMFVAFWAIHRYAVGDVFAAVGQLAATWRQRQPDLATIDGGNP